MADNPSIEEIREAQEGIKDVIKEAELGQRDLSKGMSKLLKDWDRIIDKEKESVDFRTKEGKIVRKSLVDQTELMSKVANQELSITRMKKMRKALRKQGITDQASILSQAIHRAKIEETTASIREKGVGLLQKQIIQGGLLVSAFMFLKKIAMGFAEVIDSLGAHFGVAGIHSERLQRSMVESRAQAIGIGKSMDDVIAITDTMVSEFGVGLDLMTQMDKEGRTIGFRILDSATAMGLSADEGGRLYGTLMSVGKLTLDQAEHLAESTYQLALANDVAPQAVMKDIAENTEVFAKFAGQGGENITEAAVQAKKLGLSLSDISGVAEGLLDFQSSLSAELEASLMIGRQINLQRARQFALTGDLTAMMDSVLEQLGGEAEWNKLNILQRQSMAKALGVDVAVMSRLVSEHGKLSKQESFKDLLAADTMSTLTQIWNTIKEIGASLAQDVGKSLLDVVTKVKLWLEQSGNLEKIKDIAIRIGRAFQSIGRIFEWMIDNRVLIFAILGAIKGAAFGAVGAAIGAALGGGIAAATLNDFIVRPGMRPQRFSPDDTIIGMKTPTIETHSKEDDTIKAVLGMKTPTIETPRELTMNAPPRDETTVPTVKDTSERFIRTGDYDFEIRNKLDSIALSIGDQVGGKSLIQRIDNLVTNMEKYFGYGGTIFKQGIVVKDREY